MMNILKLLLLIITCQIEEKIQRKYDQTPSYVYPRHFKNTDHFLEENICKPSFSLMDSDMTEPIIIHMKCEPIKGIRRVNAPKNYDASTFDEEIAKDHELQQFPIQDPKNNDYFEGKMNNFRVYHGNNQPINNNYFDLHSEDKIMRKQISPNKEQINHNKTLLNQVMSEALRIYLNLLQEPSGNEDSPTHKFIRNTMNDNSTKIYSKNLKNVNSDKILNSTSKFLPFTSHNRSNYLNNSETEKPSKPQHNYFTELFTDTVISSKLNTKHSYIENKYLKIEKDLMVNNQTHACFYNKKEFINNKTISY
ncbi:uncharacterized protein LOC126902623 isoform X2 [Daktulosphaira vitifoliae]|uniref:uncharacterized protein LOC126902623 isoform X2 n=1 Tax=Daktulosphaira vitifoliae TaxID=58002 RepID=UPI0021AAB38F|nr:uncharacterized protein LOC126902623 isoform X2 [Daktulosphaira vitifoliae]